MRTAALKACGARAPLAKQMANVEVRLHQQYPALKGTCRYFSTANDGSRCGLKNDNTEKGPQLGMQWTRKLFSSSIATSGEKIANRRYHWIDVEAEKLITEAYRLHLPDRPFPPSVGFDRKKLEEIDSLPHFTPQTFSDKVAMATVNVLEKIMHMFFREKYDHHAVTLETVAAVPGFVAAMHRHMRSLRRMKRDHGWIDNLLEESTNERMHLLIWMQHTQPNLVERMFVLLAQGAYVSFYSILYVLSPKTAHRSVGYLEESAFRAYTDYLKAVDSGAIPNAPLSDKSIAKRFYRLPDGSTLRDVILHVRADEEWSILRVPRELNQVCALSEENILDLGEIPPNGIIDDPGPFTVEFGLPDFASLTCGLDSPETGERMFK